MKLTLLLMIIIMIFYFLIHPASALSGAKEGIALWYGQILPTLLPFAVISAILISSNLFERLSDVKRFKRLRRIGAAELFVILCGFLFGFPIGSKLAADLYQKKLLTRKKAQILCSFTNNMSPMFVLSFVMDRQLQMPGWGPVTVFLLYAPAFAVGMIRLLRVKNPMGILHKKTASRFQLDMQIIDAGILSGFQTLIKLCGYIMFFSIGVKMLEDLTFLPDIVKVMCIGLTEVTNGIVAIAGLSVSTQIRYVLAVCCLSFGGLCGLAQTGSMIQTAGLSLSEYLRDKVLLSLLSSTLAIVYLLFC
jgi:sporulation integral membrane protein YlbJ